METISILCGQPFDYDDDLPGGYCPMQRIREIPYLNGVEYKCPNCGITMVLSQRRVSLLERIKILFTGRIIK